MRRRDVINLLGGATVFWPFVARAQRNEQTRRVGVLMNLTETDPEGQARIAAFLQGMVQIGWTDGRNVQIDIRWGAGDPERLRKYAAELVAQSPDVIVASTAVSVDALQLATRTVPIIFVQVVDPVGGDYVESLSHPGKNTTGFSNFEYGMSGKWLELLKELVPRVTRVAVIRDPAMTAGTAQLGAIQAVAPSFGVELFPVSVRDTGKIEDAVSAFARSSGGGLVVTASPWAVLNRRTIIALAARHRLPAVYSQRVFVIDGGLVAYGPDRVDQYRRAAAYVDRILKGEKPADLPVQAPTKYELAINLKTARTLGLTVPPSVLSRADEVIE